MKTLGVAQAKRTFSELLDRVRQGERFIVSRRGKPVAALVRPEDLHPEDEREPAGLLGIVGALSDVDDFDETIAAVIRSRSASKDRPVPDLG